MANVPWPTGIPATLQQDGFQESPPELTVRTEMDAGPAKIRRRFFAGTRSIKGYLLIEPNLVDTFDDFYLTDCGGGALEFDLMHPRTGTTVTARFLSAPIYSVIDYYIKIDLNLEIMP